MSPFDGTDVTVVGAVYALKGTLTEGGFYIQAESGGINYFAPNADGIAIGDTLQVEATVYSAEGEIYLHDAEIHTYEIIGTGPVPVPKNMAR